MEDAHNVAINQGRLAQMIRRFSPVQGAWNSEFSLDVSSTHESKQSKFSLLFGETKLGDAKCAEWINLSAKRSDSVLCLGWCYNQLMAICGQSRVIQLTHVLSDLFIPSWYLHPLQLSLSFTFLQLKSLWQLLFNSHWDRYLMIFCTGVSFAGKSE